MAFIDFDTIITRLNDLTTKINAIYTNSKKIFELPDATIGQKLVAVWNATDLTTQKFDLSQALDSINQLNDRITSIGTITRDVDTFEFSVGFEWIIGGLNYQNASIVELTPVAATDDYYRIDIAVLDTNNDIVLVQGFESLTIAEQPQTPPNTLFLCSFSIFGASIGTPTTPIVGSDYLKKIYQNEVNSSSISNITLPSTGQTSFNFSIGGFDIEGFDGSSELFDGKIFVLKNSSDTTINLVHAGTSTIKFKFITATDYDLIANEIITLRYSEVRGLEILGSNKSIASTPTLQEVLNEGSTATFTSADGDVLQIDEVVNSETDFYHQKSLTSSDSNNQVSESLAPYQSTRQGNFSNATYQATNQDIVAPINETSGFMNLVRSLYKEIFSSSHTGSWNLFFPTPKTGASVVNVNIEMPYKEVAGTYRVATQDEIPSIAGLATEIYVDDGLDLKEDTANKSTSTSDSASTTKFPVWSAVVSYVTSLGYWVSVNATNLVAGIMKLYTSTGSNTDGTMTQKAITDALDLKTDTATIFCQHANVFFIDGTSYFFGMLNIAPSNSTSTNRRFFSPLTGKIIAIHSFTLSGTATSSQDIVLKLNNKTTATSNTIGNIRYDNITTAASFTGLNIDVSLNDNLEFQIDVPALTTNGGNSVAAIQVIFQK